MRGLNNRGVAILCCVTNESSLVPPAPPPPPDKDTPKPRLRWLKRTVVIVFGVIVLVAGVFELWRQGTLKSERDALAAKMQGVDDTILHGKTPVAYYNAHAKRKNGWPAYQAALNMMPGQPEREEDPRLKAMVDWANEEQADEATRLPDTGTSTQWVEASDRLAAALENAASADVLARTYQPGGNWLQASISVLPEMYAWKIATLRVELLVQLGRISDAEKELCTLLQLAALRAHPANMIEGLVVLSQSAIATDLAVRLTSRQKLSAETLRKLAATWPKAVPLLAPMFEGELVWMCWMVEGEPLISSADAWFAWLPGQNRDETSLTDERGIFVGINLRRAIRKNMQHIQECLATMLEGEQLADLPEPHDALSPLAIDVRPHALRVLEHDALFSLRKAAIELRLLELEGPLAKQREKVEAFASKLHGISVKFEGDDCVLSIVPTVFPGVEFEEADATIRLKPLP